MFRKSIFIALGVFSFSSVAEVKESGMPISSEKSLLSDTAPLAAEAMGVGEAEGFWGSFELKYVNSKSGDSDRDQNFIYRARAGWKGEVNDVVKWGLSLSSDIEQAFSHYGLQSINLEQAYVAYKPVDNFHIKAGKFGWHTSFSKTSVFYDDDLYAEGVFAKFHHSMSETNKFFAKAGLVKLGQQANLQTSLSSVAAKSPESSEEAAKAAPQEVQGIKSWNGPFSKNANLLKVMAGGSFHSGDVQTKIYVGGQNDALFKEGDKKSVTLAHAGLKVTADLTVPVGAFGLYSTNSENFFKFKAHDAYTGGIFVGKAGSAKHAAEEVNDYSLAVSYYEFNDGSAWNQALVDSDYYGQGSGLAVRGQYNVLDNTNIVLKYAHALGDSKANKVVGELTFNF